MVRAAEPASSNDPVPYLQRSLTAAETKLHEEPTSLEAACQYARACFERAEFPTNSAHRAELARRGMAAARSAITMNSNSAPAHYYLAMNLGQLARTKMLGALPLVDEMEVEFKKAVALDELLDHAGPDRFLGRLYFEAPVIGSVGSRGKAKKHFKRAAELAPEYPENKINLIEAALRWKDYKTAREELEILDASLAAARARYSGEKWIATWLDWDARLEKINSALRK